MVGCLMGKVRFSFFFFQAEDGIRDYKVTGVQTCALPICRPRGGGRRYAGAAARRCGRRVGYERGPSPRILLGACVNRGWAGGALARSRQPVAKLREYMPAALFSLSNEIGRAHV